MRINLLGGPGSGKSTTAAWLFSELKRKLVSVEHVNEYVKAWAYANRPVDHYDQIYFMAKQMQYEYRFLKNGVKNIVTDSPVDLSIVYAPEHLKPAMRLMCQTYNKDFDFVNIFIARGDKPYVQEGRYQDKKCAMEVDQKIIMELGTMQEFYFGDPALLDYVLQRVKK
jgi:tRNA uridine 5-carbamoylmethylation protein Kti12